MTALTLFAGSIVLDAAAIVAGTLALIRGDR